MLLNFENIDKIINTQIEKPSKTIFSFPERIIQFGTGVLLRGLPDYYIDQANKRGKFNGRIVVVKSTDKGGDLTSFNQQNNLYTTAIKGIQNGRTIERYIINGSISRVLSASDNWSGVLKVAEDYNVNILISNTTEAGIVESSDDIFASPPQSFPSKVTSYLYHRYKHFQGDTKSGMIIIPTELISNNADQLKSFVLKLAVQQQLPESFIKWIQHCNYFCNSLVDRIVPGRLDSSTLEYEDNLSLMTEPFSLWAIESSSPYVQEKLSFSQHQPSIKIIPCIENYKEIKLRLLNACHTLSCGVGLLGNFPYVKDALDHPEFEKFIKQLLMEEISPCLWQIGITKGETQEFASAVIDRFKNPFLFHSWSSIALNFTSKMKLRVLPLIDIWYKTHQKPPMGIALGFAAYLFATKDHPLLEYINIDDSCLDILNNHWENSENPIHNILADSEIWGKNLTMYPYWEETISDIILRIERESIEAVLFDLI